MVFRYRWIIFFVMVGFFAGCATKQDFERLEQKVDQLIRATNRSTLDEIFGEQAAQVSLMVKELGLQQRRRFDNLQQEYSNGNMAVEKVRQEMLSVLGNNDRVVSTRRGIYIRNIEGTKLEAIPNDTKITNCHLLAEKDVPVAIQLKPVLDRFSWGLGELDGKIVLFPWELTISSFTKEVAEHTARRTAEEFIRMGGEPQWKRPIQIQISTEKDDQIKVTTSEEKNEVFFEYENLDSKGAESDRLSTDTKDTAETPDEVGPWSVK